MSKLEELYKIEELGKVEGIKEVEPTYDKITKGDMILTLLVGVQELVKRVQELEGKLNNPDKKLPRVNDTWYVSHKGSSSVFIREVTDLTEETVELSNLAYTRPERYRRESITFIERVN